MKEEVQIEDRRASLSKATAWAHAGSTAAAFTFQAIAFQTPFEPGSEDLVEFDDVWSSDDFPSPVSAYHRTTRAYLQGIGDLLVGITESFQNGLPLLVATATLSRSVVEYSARILFILDADAQFAERLGRAARMLESGLDNAGGRNPQAHRNVTEVADPFYKWYEEAERELVKAIGHRPASFNSGNAADQKKVLGRTFQKGMYRHLSDLAHGNGPATLALHDATLGSDRDKHEWTQANSIGRILYAQECALLAAQAALRFTDPTDTRTVAEILPYLDSDGIDLYALPPADLTRVFLQETKLVQGNLLNAFEHLGDSEARESAGSDRAEDNTPT